MRSRSLEYPRKTGMYRGDTRKDERYGSVIEALPKETKKTDAGRQFRPGKRVGCGRRLCQSTQPGLRKRRMGRGVSQINSEKGEVHELLGTSAQTMLVSKLRPGGGLVVPFSSVKRNTEMYAWDSISYRHTRGPDGSGYVHAVWFEAQSQQQGGKKFGRRKSFTAPTQTSPAGSWGKRLVSGVGVKGRRLCLKGKGRRNLIRKCALWRGAGRKRAVAREIRGHKSTRCRC